MPMELWGLQALSLSCGGAGGTRDEIQCSPTSLSRLVFRRSSYGQVLPVGYRAQHSPISCIPHPLDPVLNLKWMPLLEAEQADGAEGLNE